MTDEMTLGDILAEALAMKRGPLAIDEKLSVATYEARQEVAEKHFFDEAQPFSYEGFSVGYRNPGHWDIYADRPAYKEKAHNAIQPEEYHRLDPCSERVLERAFRIRGEPGNVCVLDERSDPHRPHPREPLCFRSIAAAMLWISEELMQEPDKRNPFDD